MAPFPGRGSGAVTRGRRPGARNADDGRAVDVFMSPAGAALAIVVEAEVARALAPLTTGLSTSDRHRLRSLLEALDAPSLRSEGRGGDASPT